MNYAFAIPWLSVGLIVTIMTTKILLKELGDQKDWSKTYDSVSTVYLLVAFAFFLFWVLGPILLGLYIAYLFGRLLARALG